MVHSLLNSSKVLLKKKKPNANTSQTILCFIIQSQYCSDTKTRNENFIRKNVREGEKENYRPIIW